MRRYKRAMRQILARVTVMPVLTVHDVHSAAELAAALVRGGVVVFEVLLRTPQALDAVKAMIEAAPEADIGLGTLLTAEDVQAAVEAGVAFGVSPGLTPSLAQADMVHCDARWVNGAETALKAAKALGLPRMIDGDIAPKHVLDRIVPLATYAVFSDAGLLGYTGATNVETALLHIASGHEGHVGATCGADGYFWVQDGQICHVDTPVVNVVDTLSAGDVFHGALALALLEGQAIERAARFACVAAALKCTRFGGRLGCPSRDEVDAFLLQQST